MSSAVATTGPGPTEAASARIVRLWRDTVRTEQLARLRALELQPGDDFGERAWQLAYEQWRQLPDEARIDLPSSRVFGRVLGLLRTGATLKTGKLLRLELAAQELAELVGYSKSTVEAALRWLGSEPIEYAGQQLARGIGLVHRGRRTAWAYLKGRLQRIYRTSRLVLTLFGRVTLGLDSPDEDRAAKRRERAARRKTPTTAPAPRQQAEPERGQGAQAPPPTAPPDEPRDGDLGKQWIKRILEAL